MDSKAATASMGPGEQTANGTPYARTQHIEQPLTHEEDTNMKVTTAALQVELNRLDRRINELTNTRTQVWRELEWSKAPSLPNGARLRSKSPRPIEGILLFGRAQQLYVKGFNSEGPGLWLTGTHTVVHPNGEASTYNNEAHVLLGWEVVK